MSIRFVFLGFILAATGAVAAEPGMTFGPPYRVAAEAVIPHDDVPAGAPYHVGSNYEAGDTSVPLRDYLSSRIDQLRQELIDRMDERDQRYAQRFQAQQEALTSALSAAKEAVSNALAAAKEAVVKAENAVEKRFEGVNEFRKQLDDQADTFISKDTAVARFNSLEEKVSAIQARLDQTKNISEGQSNVWAYLIAALGAVAVIVGLYLNVTARLNKPLIK